MSLDLEIKEVFEKMGHELSTYDILNSRWSSNSQYGYCMAVFETRKEAEEYTIGYYSKNIHLIRQ